VIIWATKKSRRKPINQSLVAPKKVIKERVLKMSKKVFKATKLLPKQEQFALIDTSNSEIVKMGSLHDILIEILNQCINSLDLVEGINVVLKEHDTGFNILKINTE